MLKLLLIAKYHQYEGISIWGIDNNYINLCFFCSSCYFMFLNIKYIESISNIKNCMGILIVIKFLNFFFQKM